MQINIPDGWMDALLTGGMGLWALDKAHAAIIRHKSLRQKVERQEITADLVTEGRCAEHRSACQGRVNGELAAGNKAFDWLEAAIRLLVRRSGITPQEIEAEMSMLRRKRVDGQRG